MATYVLKNQQRGCATYLVTSTNTNIQVTDFATPNTSIETVTGATITKILWNGDWTLARVGGPSMVFSGEGHWDLQMYAAPLNSVPAANVSVTAGAQAGSMIIEFTKNSTSTTDQYNRADEQ